MHNDSSLSQPLLITGGTGFVGSHLVETLLKAGYTNVHVTTYGSEDSVVNKLLDDTHIHALDLTDFEATSALLTKLQPSQIYHLAAFATVGNSFDKGQRVLENNLKLQMTLLEAVKQHTPQARLLVVGSGMEYDFSVKTSDSNRIDENHPLGPVSPYAVSKVLQDLLGLSYAYSYKLDIVRARPFNHTGERQTPDFAIPSFAKQIVAIERGEQTEIKVGNLDAVRDFTDVKDICDAYLLLMKKGQTGQVYNIGSGHGYTMKALLDMLCQLSTSDIPISQDATKMRPLDVPAIVADTSKITALGWQPTITIQETLERVLNYWRSES